MRRLRFALCLTLLTAFGPMALAANRPTLPTATAESAYRGLEGPVTPAESQLFLDAADGRFDQHSLLGAAMLASGSNDLADLANCQRRLAQWLAELGPLSGTPRQQAQALFEFMHAKVLTGGYARNATDLRLVFHDGQFNCVSATVLFHCLAEAVGLNVRGLEIPGHAMVRLVEPAGSLDIETTCPRWFRLIGDPQQQSDLVAKTLGFRPGDPAKRVSREVSPVELTAMIYYNRGVDLLAAEQFEEASAANAKALRLDPSNTTARGNLLATINNWGVWLGTHGRYTEAAEVLRRGLAIDVGYDPFGNNFAYVHHQWTEALTREHRYAEALALLETAGRQLPGKPYFAEAKLGLWHRWAEHELAEGRVDAAVARFDEAMGQLGPTPLLVASERATFNRRAVSLIDQQSYPEAVALLDLALTRHPQVLALVDNRRSAIMRWAEQSFVQGNFAEAIRRTTYGGTPGALHPDLVNNVRVAYQRWIDTLTSAGQAEAARQVAHRAAADPFLRGQPIASLPFGSF